MFYRPGFLVLIVMFIFALLSAVWPCPRIKSEYRETLQFAISLICLWIGVLSWTLAILHDKELGGDALAMTAAILSFLGFGFFAITLAMKLTGESFCNFMQAYLGNGVFDCSAVEPSANDICMKNQRFSIVLSLAGYVHTTVYLAVLLSGFNWMRRSGAARLAWASAAPELNSSGGSSRLSSVDMSYADGVRSMPKTLVPAFFKLLVLGGALGFLIGRAVKK